MFDNDKHISEKVQHIIENPDVYDWAGSDWFETKKLALEINDAIIACDGKEGRPTRRQAVDFYKQVIELGGGRFFCWEYCTQPDGLGSVLKRSKDLQVLFDADMILRDFYEDAQAIHRDENGHLFSYCRRVPPNLDDKRYTLEQFICFPERYDIDEMSEEDFATRLAEFAQNLKVNNKKSTVEAILSFYEYWFEQGYGYLLVDSFINGGVGEVIKMYRDGRKVWHADVQHMYLKLHGCPPRKVEKRNKTQSA